MIRFPQNSTPTVAVTHQVIIGNALKDVGIVRDALDRFGQEHGMDVASLVQLQVALDELVSNVIKYAWADGRKHEVIVRFAAAPDCLRVEIVDDGMPFNPCDAAPPKLHAGERLKPGGVGIHMVRQLVDGLEYVRLDDRNHIRLVKRRAQAAPRQGAE
jgi:anti-sigma regulatory factor (Ser/Thr protein kinase)